MVGLAPDVSDSAFKSRNRLGDAPGVLAKTHDILLAEVAETYDEVSLGCQLAGETANDSKEWS